MTSIYIDTIEAFEEQSGEHLFFKNSRITTYHPRRLERHHTTVLQYKPWQVIWTNRVREKDEHMFFAVQYTTDFVNYVAHNATDLERRSIALPYYSIQKVLHYSIMEFVSQTLVRVFND